MEWIEITVYTTADGIEPVCGRLYQLGINGVSIEDEADFNDFLENNRGSWDYVDDDLVEKMKGETNVKFYVPNTPDGLETLSEAERELKELKEYDKDGLFGRLYIDKGTLSEEDWANNWKKYFHILEIGDRIIVRPEWEEYENKDGKTVFTINPGMSFGTGSHHTTKMCLEVLDKVINEGDSVLDLGSGSGILSLVSILLGANSALAVDIDPMTVGIAYNNADLNGVDKSKFTAISGNILEDDELKSKLLEKKYDVVCANIVADVIIATSELAYNALKDGGTFITSGIIEDRMEDVLTKLKSVGFKVLEEKRSADWAAFVCTK